MTHTLEESRFIEWLCFYNQFVQQLKTGSIKSIKSKFIE